MSAPVMEEVLTLRGEGVRALCVREYLRHATTQTACHCSLYSHSLYYTVLHYTVQQESALCEGWNGLSELSARECVFTFDSLMIPRALVRCLVRCKQTKG
jgi:hypothetical protein